MKNIQKSNVIVLYGALRSGTTMVRLMLNAHSQIVCPGERDFLVGHLVRQDGALMLDSQSLTDNRIFRATGLQVPENLQAKDAFWDMVQQHDFADKTLVLILHRHMEELLEIFPDARIVHLVRDPRDVARSSIGMGWAGNTYFGVDHWLGTEREWDNHAHKLSQDQTCLVRFEELLADPEGELGRICDFANLSFDAQMLNYDETSTYSKVDPSLAYQWKRKQTEQEIGELESKVGPLLMARGYELSGHAMTAPAGLRLLKLKVNNKRSKIAERVRRFGVKDTLLSTFATRLGLTGLRRSVHRRMDEKMKAYLK